MKRIFVGVLALVSMVCCMAYAEEPKTVTQKNVRTFLSGIWEEKGVPVSAINKREHSFSWGKGMWGGRLSYVFDLMGQTNEIMAADITFVADEIMIDKKKITILCHVYGGSTEKTAKFTFLIVSPTELSFISKESSGNAFPATLVKVEGPQL